MLNFLGIVGTFTGHSISLGEDNGSLDGGLHAQLMIKKYLTSMIILYMSFKKRSVISFNRRDESLNKNTTHGITSSYKYCHRKLRLLKIAHRRFKKLHLLCNLSSSF